MELLFKNDWMQILNKEGRYIIQYNTGDLIDSILEIEVSKEDAEKAQENDQSAYDIIIKYQNKVLFDN